MPNYFKQHEFAICCEWGISGIAALLPASDVIIIVDVLSFSICVDVALNNGLKRYTLHVYKNTTDKLC